MEMVGLPGDVIERGSGSPWSKHVDTVELLFQNLWGLEFGRTEDGSNQ